MVAITVILAAVIGTFVLGLGGQVESAPQASFDFQEDKSNDRLEITHRGGDSIDPSDLEIRIEGTEQTSFGPSGGNDLASAIGTEFSAGTTIEIQESAFTSGERETVDIVYVSGDSDDIIGSFETSNGFGN
jgi:FlaG/FlaF family flagellin (archaellin)